MVYTVFFCSGEPAFIRRCEGLHHAVIVTSMLTSGSGPSLLEDPGAYNDRDGAIARESRARQYWDERPDPVPRDGALCNESLFRRHLRAKSISAEKNRSARTCQGSRWEATNSVAA